MPNNNDLNNDLDELASDYAGQVSVTHRIHADMFIGKREFNSLTDIVKAAFIDGFKAAKELQSELH